MAEKFRLYYDQVMDNKDLIGTDNPMNVEVMDLKEKVWIPAKVMVSEQPVEGWDQAGVVGIFGNVEEGKFFINIVEELPFEDED